MTDSEAKNTVTVIVAALNEEQGVEATVRTVLRTVPRWFSDWEVLVFDDGSTDGTGEIADRLASTLDRVRAIHNKRPSCLGGVFKAGALSARMEYVILFNGKNDTPADAMDRIFSRCGEADLVIPFQANLHERPFVRSVISRAFVALLNASFDMKLRYYNHSVLHRLDLVRPVELRTDSYAFQAELVIKLLRQGCTYIEVGVNDRFPTDGVTKALSWSNLTGVLRFLATTRYDVFRKPADAGTLAGKKAEAEREESSS